MNMPLDKDMKVHFTTTLFALIRENLSIKVRSGTCVRRSLKNYTANWRIAFSAEEMDQADEELRATVQIIWPLQAKKMLDLLIPRNDGSCSESKFFNSNCADVFVFVVTLI